MPRGLYAIFAFFGVVVVLVLLWAWDALPSVSK